MTIFETPQHSRNANEAWNALDPIAQTHVRAELYTFERGERKNSETKKSEMHPASAVGSAHWLAAAAHEIDPMPINKQ